MQKDLIGKKENMKNKKTNWMKALKPLQKRTIPETFVVKHYEVTVLNTPGGASLIIPLGSLIELIGQEAVKAGLEDQPMPENAFCHIPMKGCFKYEEDAQKWILEQETAVCYIVNDKNKRVLHLRVEHGSIVEYGRHTWETIVEDDLKAIKEWKPLRK